MGDPENGRSADGRLLSEGERHEVEHRASVGAHIVHEAVRREGEHEISRPVEALAWSGLAAGLSMGFSLVTQGLLDEHLEPGPTQELLVPAGYTVGFLIVVLGRQQLFTENTLTAILPLMADFSRKTLWRVLRLWGVVLAFNLLGALAFACAVAWTGLFEPAVHASFAKVGYDALQPGWGQGILSGIFGGWLIALMVWLLPGANGSRPMVILLVTYLVGLGGFAHVIAGSVDVFYLLARGDIGLGVVLSRFLIPAAIGNTIGGVSFVAAINHAQVVAGRARREEHERRREREA